MEEKMALSVTDLGYPSDKPMTLDDIHTIMYSEFYFPSEGGWIKRFAYSDLAVIIRCSRQCTGGPFVYTISHGVSELDVDSLSITTPNTSTMIGHYFVSETVHGLPDMQMTVDCDYDAYALLNIMKRLGETKENDAFEPISVTLFEQLISIAKMIKYDKCTINTVNALTFRTEWGKEYNVEQE